LANPPRKESSMKSAENRIKRLETRNLDPDLDWLILYELIDQPGHYEENSTDDIYTAADLDRLEKKYNLILVRYTEEAGPS